MRHDFDAQFEHWRPTAIRIARAFKRKLPPSVDYADLEQAAFIGLWKALRKEQPPGLTADQVRFFVYQRVRGAVIDELRDQDWLPRYGHRRDGAAHVGHLEDLGADGASWEYAIPSDAPSPEAELAALQASAIALQAPLDPIDRECFERVVLREELLQDVAASLGVSPARVSQRYARALETMRIHLTGRHVPPAHRTSLLSPRAAERLLNLTKDRKP